MAETFDIADRYSEALKDSRGPGSLKDSLDQPRAWIVQSLGRRNAARAIGAGVLLFGLAWFLKRRGDLWERVGKIQNKVAS